MLALTREEIVREVSRYLGFDPSALDANGYEVVEDAVSNGLRNFYYNIQGHAWSFLQRATTIALSVGETEYALPANFVRPSGGATIDGSDLPIRLVSPREMQSLLRSGATDDSEGVKYYAVEIDATAEGTVYQARVYPVPTSVQTLRVRYLCLPDEGVILGGVEHARTIIESCLAMAEQSMNLEALPEAGGYHANRFNELLQVSIGIDRQMLGESPGIQE